MTRIKTKMSGPEHVTALQNGIYPSQRGWEVKENIVWLSSSETTEIKVTAFTAYV